MSRPRKYDFYVRITEIIAISRWSCVAQFLGVVTLRVTYTALYTAAGCVVPVV